MRFKGIVFDLDGTLVHTKPEYRYLAVGNVLKEFNVKPVKEHIDKFWFETNRNEIIQKHFGIEPFAFWKKFLSSENLELRKKATSAYPDVFAIKNLRGMGIKTGIVTGSPKNILEMEIAFLGEELFDSIVSARSKSGLQPKPNPHALEKCISEIGVSKEEAAFVGNSDEDILTAHNAGVCSIFIDRKEHLFKYSKKPDLVIDSLDELEKIYGED